MKECKSTLTWKEAPETITPLDLAKILGIGENKAREMFNRKDFPRIKGTGVKQIADKQVTHLWIKGFNISSNNNVLLVNILDVLQQINSKLEMIKNGKEN